MSVVDPRQVRAAWWGGRVLLLGAVAYWWGTIVVPRLVSLVFPQWLPADAIPWHLDPESGWKRGERGSVRPWRPPRSSPS